LGTELSSSENERVEHAESEENSFVLGVFVSLGFGEFVLAEFTESSSDVRLEVLWGLIGNFKSVLKDGLRNDFSKRLRWWLR